MIRLQVQQSTGTSVIELLEKLSVAILKWFSDN